MMKLAALAVASIGIVSADVVSETWDRAGSVMSTAEETLSEVRKHAEEAAARETDDVEAARQSMRDSEQALEKSARVFQDAEKKLLESKENVKDTPSDSVESSSFLEFPEAFSNLPGVKDDMEKVREAERRYKETMGQLRSQDDDLMNMARKNFADAGSAVSKIGSLRSKQGASFLEMDKRGVSYSVPETFRKVLEAEANLKKVNEELAKEFHLA